MNTYEERLEQDDDAIARISRHIRDAERAGDTGGAALLYSGLCKAQRAYARAQAVLAANPLPGDAVRS